MDPGMTGISFVNNVVESDSLNIFDYLYLYNGAGVAVGDINNDGLEDIFFVGNLRGSNKLYLNRGNFRFEDITGKAGVAGTAGWSTGVSMVDINGDGWLDIYVCTVNIPGLFNSTNELFINNHDGTFTESAGRYGLAFSGHSTQAMFFDYDKDGDLDCFLVNHSVNTFDYSGDTAIRRIMDPASGDKLFRNDGGRFIDVTGRAGIISSKIAFGLGVTAGDLNNDGWEDIYVGNDFRENDYCYINNHDGTFSESSGRLFPHTSRYSMGCDIADYNNDGWEDIITLDMLSPDQKVLKSSIGDDDNEVYAYKHRLGFNYQYSRNCLQKNLGNGNFQDIALQAGVAATDWSWAPLMADFDNDGWKDLFISNGVTRRTNDLDFNKFLFADSNSYLSGRRGDKRRMAIVRQMPSGAVHHYFFTGAPDGGFRDRSAEAGFDQPALGNGVAYADLDNDGRLDLVVNCLNQPAGIYRNEAAGDGSAGGGSHYLQVRLAGAGANTSAIGTNVFAYSKHTVQRLHQQPCRGFMSGVSHIMQIGLGKDTIVDSLRIVWPDGKRQMIRDIKAGQRVEVREEEGAGEGSGANGMFGGNEGFGDSAANYVTDLAATLGLGWSHREDAFDDLAVERLLPHSLATQGPRMAIADVNGDGLEDLFVCGAKGQPGVLFVQDRTGMFIQADQPVFRQDSLFEGIDAQFFDANNDGHPDLYVVSGGNEYFGSQPTLHDRLYLNDGKGNFSRGKGLPPMLENKSCARAADFDRDGAQDLFIGGRSNARSYGVPVYSALLRNDGHGNFTDMTDQLAPGLATIGMVTDACWEDLDHNGYPDLIVVGEWMPVTFFMNYDGHLERKEMLSGPFSGWWTCIRPISLDAAGNRQFLLGNWGTNSKLQASVEYPLRLYLGDWDHNGEKDPILATGGPEGYFPFSGKEEIERRLPFIKKKYLKYRDMAGKTVEEIFGAEAESCPKLEAVTLQSCLLHQDRGRWKLDPLPDFLQTAPVFGFAEMPGAAANGREANNRRDHGRQNQGRPGYIAAGNFYGVVPYEGMYDAMLPVLFDIDAGKVTGAPMHLPFRGEFRDARVIRSADGGQLLLLARNNGPLTVLRLPKGGAR